MYKKSYRHSGKITRPVYAEVFKKTEAAKKEGHQISVSGMLMILGVSRSDYYSWLHRHTSKSVIHREKLKRKLEKSMTTLIKTMVLLRLRKN